MNEDELQAILEHLLDEGKIRRVWVEGESHFELTADGKAHVQLILDEVLELAVRALSEKLDLPAYVARDLLINHAIEMAFADE